MSRSFVLCYHAVSDEWPDALAVRPRELARQLRALRVRGYRGAPLDAILDGRRRAVHATFDDAYRNVVSALPVLERLSVPATVFACAAYADTGAPLAVPELRSEVETHPAQLETMRWDALRELAERGVEIGSHTVSHPHLPHLGDAELRAELADSRERCEAELARPCRYVAYPYGEHDPRVRAAARAAGYDAAFALDARAGDRFAVPRVDLYRGDGAVVTTLKTSPLRRSVGAAVHAARLRGPRTPA
jgi:peptidoglycan/xylan/chitin deacetylase (PgdA/CDA1 family)